MRYGIGDVLNNGIQATTTDPRLTAPVNTGSSSNTVLLLGGAALVLFLIMRGRR